MTADDMKVVQQCLDVVNNGKNIEINPREGGYEVHCNGKLAFWFSITHCMSDLKTYDIWVNGKKWPTIYDKSVYVNPDSLLGSLYFKCKSIYDKRIEADQVTISSFLGQFTTKREK